MWGKVMSFLHGVRPGVQHVLGQSTRNPIGNKTKMYICVFCCYLSQQVEKDGSSESAGLFGAMVMIVQVVFDFLEVT